VTLHSAEALDELLTALVEDDPVQLYDRAPCGYLSTEPDGAITKVNHTFLRMTGYSERELVGRRRFVDLLSAGGRLYHETHYMPLLHLQGTAREIALDLVCSDGRRLPVLVNAVLERDERAQPRVVRAAVFDATQRRQYEQELLLAKSRAEASEARARALAQTLQQTLIPPSPPAIPGLDVAARYRPAGDGVEVGGDFYDLFAIGPDDWVVLIGDVSGKGVEAAVVTALARFTLRAAAVEHREPGPPLRVLHSVLLGHESGRFCTVALLRVRRDGSRFACELAVAGHPLPLVRGAGGQVREVGSPGTPIGLLDSLEAVDVSFWLDPGEAIVLFTDGVPEGRSAQGFYGESRLRDVVTRTSGSAEDLADAIVTDVVGFEGGLTRDDIAVVVLAVPS
jgi:sigma-B regulation protein RsbU (phosphoserine phosphatase)